MAPAMRDEAYDGAGDVWVIDVWVILEHSLRVVEVAHNDRVIVNYAVEQALRVCA